MQMGRGKNKLMLKTVNRKKSGGRKRETAGKEGKGHQKTISGGREKKA